MSEKRCAICGSTEDLVLHHMDGFHGAFLPKATVWLCRSCHARIHKKHDRRFFKWKEAERIFKEEVRRLLND